MKYLAHFRPDSELSELIQLQDNVRVPSSGLHCTICHFEMDESIESRFMGEFRKIHFEPFYLDTIKLVCLDNFATGLELSKPHELEKLHDKIVRIARKYVDSKKEFDDFVRQYYHKNYLPHITISKHSQVNENNPDAEILLKRTFYVNEVFLAKEKTRWFDINKIHAKDYDEHVA